MVHRGCIPVFRMTSGARYSGVPHSVYVSPISSQFAITAIVSVKPTVLNFLCKSKVNQFQVPLGVDEYVFRLQVPICNSLFLVQEFKYENDLSGVELGRGFIETARSSEVTEHFAAGTVIELLGQ